MRTGAGRGLEGRAVHARPNSRADVSVLVATGMWIVPCNGIHMMFMNFAIDAVFLDRDNRVKKVYPRLPAWWGVVWIEWGAHSVLELPAGSTASLGLLAGDEISIVS
jgi:uncharacterized membrane protein (UPF0127 family)